MKKFFAEFKKFITRGNVVDMAVGVIVGSSFTAIVNAMSNNILKPLINFILARILGKDSLSEVYTFLQKAFAEDGSVDLAQSIYIDWGAFINAVINFFIVAFVLFCIVKAINNMREDSSERKLKKARRKELRENGIKPKNKAAADAYFAKKKAQEDAAAAAAAAAEAEKAAADRLANPTTEDLLKQILEQLKIHKHYGSILHRKYRHVQA